MERDDLAIPDGLSSAGKRAAEIILKVLKKHDMTYTGGCRAFYTPKEWCEREEKYGLNSELIVCHDGGNLAHFFNWDYEEYALLDEMFFALEEEGYTPDPCYGWYTAIYS